MTWRATYTDTGVSCPVTLADVMARVDIEGDEVVWVDADTVVAGAWLFTREAE